MDNIIITPILLSSSTIRYKKKSISAFDKEYLFKGKYPYRWKVSKAKIPKHKGKGYSDHLAVIAEFSVQEDTN